MAQSAPIYPHMASVANPIIQNFLRKNCKDNLSWPIVWLKDDNIQWYTFEITKFCNINTHTTNIPQSVSGKTCYLVDYISNPRIIIPSNKLLLPSINPKYDSSYEYIIDTNTYNSVHINYVWKTNDTLKALEFTTFYVDFTSKSKAESLVSQIYKRPTWKKGLGPKALEKQIEAALDLNCSRYIMGCVNSTGNVNNEIKVNGNAYWFDLDSSQIGRLLAGNAPLNGNFGRFEDFLNELLK